VKTPTRAQLARAARKDRIIEVAGEIAEAEGWGAVTVRRLAHEISYSQPVLYGHFPDGRDGIVRAVALDGFGRIAAALGEVDPGAGPGERLRGIAERYLAFAREHAAAYEAMFSLPTDLAFAAATTPEELRAAFRPLVAAVGGDETRAETLWSALHGLADLARHGRLRPDHEAARVALLIDIFG
jgi:AcrR family transcriptional regulator